MNETQSNFFKSAVPAAQAAQRKWGVPASVTLAQAVLESGWGRSALARMANNFFGIKAAAHADPGSYMEFQTTEFIDGRKDRLLARFARYAAPAESFDAHSVLLSMTTRYKPAMAVNADPFEFARKLQSCGYSTNPNYASQVIQLINQFDLTQYDIPPEDPAKAQEAAA